MPKRKSLKESKATNEECNAAEEKPCTSSKKANVIDDIFASKKRKKQEQEKAESNSDKKEKPRKKKKKKTMRKGYEACNNDPKPIRRTNDGLAVYTEEDLKINSQDTGSTALCPFDCTCCF